MYFDHIYPTLPFRSSLWPSNVFSLLYFLLLNLNFFYIPLSLISVYRYVPSTVTWATYKHPHTEQK